MASCALVAATHALEAAYGAAAVGDSLEAWASDEERAAERAPQGADAQAARGDGGDEAVRRSLEKLHGQYQGTAPEAGGGGGEKVREVRGATVCTNARARFRTRAAPRANGVAPGEWSAPAPLTHLTHLRPACAPHRRRARAAGRGSCVPRQRSSGLCGAARGQRCGAVQCARGTGWGQITSA